MLLNLRKYYRPRSIEAVIRLLSANPGRCAVLAGGTHLLAVPRQDVEEVVDISSLKLKSVKQENGNIRIGATTTLQSILNSPRLRKVAGGIVEEACRRSSVSRMIRNQRTLGGEICGNWKRSDLGPVLLALRARVKLVNFSMEEKEFPISDFWSMLAPRPGKRGLGQGVPGLVLEIVIPTPVPTSSAAFGHVAQIESQPSLISGAAILEFGDDNQCHEARVAVSCFTDSPCRLPQLEANLQGKMLTRELIASSCSIGWEDFRPITDSRATANYRRVVAPVLVRRLLDRCLAEGSH